MQPKPLRHLFEAMHHGKYEFDDFLHADVTSSYTPIHIKQRAVYRPDKKLKAYQVFLNIFVFEHLEINERVVYSYRKGINPHEMAFPHASNRAFFQTDIENFFGSIDRRLTKATILRQKDKIPISDLDLHIDRILELTVINDALPIGFPTSPPISNVDKIRSSEALHATVTALLAKGATIEQCPPLRYDEPMEKQIESLIAGLGWEIVISCLLVAGGFLISYLLHRRPLRAMRRDLEAMRAQLAQREATDTKPLPGSANEADTPDTTVDYIGACAIVDAYISPATRDMRDSIRLVVRHDFMNRFDKVTGAKLGEYEYNRPLLHQWMQSNAARFLVENRANMH